MNIDLFAAKNRWIHHQLWRLAGPMIVSNIAVPLLGLVDTAVIGHLPETYYLGGTALGTAVINTLFFLMAVMRMSTTGFAAQAHGRNHPQEMYLVLMRALLVGGVVALLVLLLHPLIGQIVFSLVKSSTEVRTYGLLYFEIRIWSTPAIIANYVMLGWLLGMQDARAPMLLLITTNVINMMLDLLFVTGFGMTVDGVALAGVMADYSGMILASVLVWRTLRSHRASAPLSELRHIKALLAMLSVKRDILLRTLLLECSFLYFIFEGARLGDDIVAANAVLFNFLLLIAYALDGLAYAVEALVGRFIGAQDRQHFLYAIQATFFWAGLFSVLMFPAFLFGGGSLIALLTDIPAIRDTAILYLPWLACMPLFGVWCFIWDGIFIGATLAREMRNMMLWSTIIFFIPALLLPPFIGNHGLWIAMLTLMAARGVTMWISFVRLDRAGRFIPLEQFSGR